MIEMLEAAEGVIALKVTGRLSREELDRIADLLEASLDTREKTHLLVEIEDFSGLEAAALPTYLPRAVAMLGKLDRFGRIAVVSDLGWIRWATRLESALLPRISYETFTANEREAALAWVEGATRLAHRPAIRVIETDKDDVLGFEIDGKVSALEIEALCDHFAAAIAAGRPLRLMARIRDLAGAEIGGLFTRKYFDFKLALLDRTERYAVVGGPLWLTAWVGALDPFVKAELRHFAAEDEEAAWQWLQALPKAERALVA